MAARQAYRPRRGKGKAYRSPDFTSSAGTTLVPLCRVYLVDARVDHYGGLAVRGDAGKGTLDRGTYDSEPIETGYLTPHAVWYGQPINTACLLGTCIWHVEVKKLAAFDQTQTPKGRSPGSYAIRILFSPRATPGADEFKIKFLSETALSNVVVITVLPR